MGTLGGELGDVVEVDVVFGAGSRSHYELQALLSTVVVLMLGTIGVVVTLVYQNQGNVKNAGWCRPKERGAGERLLPARPVKCGHLSG